MRIVVSLICRSLISATIFMIPYIQTTYYNELVGALGVTRSQVGVLMTVFTLVSTAIYIPGGWIVDRTDPKMAMVVSSVSTGVVGLWAAFNLNYTVFIIAWVLFAVTTNLLYMGGSIKAVRMLAPAGSIGKTYAMSSVLALIVATLIGFIGNGIYAMFEGTPNAFRNVLIMYACFNIVTGLITLIFFRFPKEAVVLEKKEKVSGRVLINTLKNPVTWVIAFLVFFCYAFMAGGTYFTPYFADVFGFDASSSQVFGVIRNYGLAVVFVPLAGWLGDKFGTISKVMAYIFVICSVVLVGVLVGGSHLSIAVMVVVSLAIVASSRVLESMQFATPPEAGVATEVAGIVAAVSSMVGYLPDLFIHQMFGAWLDNYGNQGYTYIFLTMLVCCAAGIACACYIIRVHNRLAAAK